MRAAEQHRLRRAGLKRLLQIDPGDLPGDRMVDPALFDKRNQQRTGLLRGMKTQCLAVLHVRVRLNSRRRSQNEHLRLRMLELSGPNDRLDDSNDRDRNSGMDLGKRQRRGRIAGDNQQTGTTLFKEGGAFDGVTGDGGLRLRTIGQARSVSEVDVVRVRDKWQQSPKDRQASEAGVEDADDR